MTYLFNDPAEFANELVTGFVAANSDVVRRVTGGVVRNARAVPSRPSVVIGGGSGHYPAFAGLVGAGLAHGAAMGNLFASPSAHQVHAVAKAAASDGGVLLSYGNYAGDVLNFDQAEAQLNAEGIRCRTVVVTDDVSSASRDEAAKRRGIAGTLVVFKIAGAAADAGADLDEVWRLASSANARTRSLGVAFSGCTLPGATEPLFSVPVGRMAVGMGIHGEPGIDETSVPTANELAERFVSTLLAEAPEGVESDGGRVAVILNGLGSLKYEELFVVYARVADLLRGAGLTIVEPEVGEFVTSFEMAGASLTLCWLNDELEDLWRASAYTPAYRKGRVDAAEQRADTDELDDETAAIGPSTQTSRDAAAIVLEALRTTRSAVNDNVDELGRLDSIAGDGDHGIGMQRGASAAVEAAEAALEQGAGAGTLLAIAGDAWADKGGGTSGALWGLGLRAIAAHLGDETTPGTAELAGGLASARDEIARFGKAELGDKTMLDTLLPLIDSIEQGVAAGDAIDVLLARSADVADAAAASTSSLVPKIGRARPHASKSIGTPDPGAVSLALIVRAIQKTTQQGQGND
jgi:dihydroxyacetone kinase